MVVVVLDDEGAGVEIVVAGRSCCGGCCEVSSVSSCDASSDSVTGTKMKDILTIKARFT